MINIRFAKEDPALIILQGEIVYLRAQNEKLLSIIESLHQKPALKVSSPEDFRPKKFDPNSGSYVPKTDAEIEEDRKALIELGVL